MKKIFKICLITIITLIVISILYATYNAFFYQNYLKNASFLTSSLIVIGIVFLISFAIYSSKKIWTLVAIAPFILLSLQSCNYAKSNQQVLISEDCGVNWKYIKAGDAVPKGTMNPCFQKVVIPNYPMQGNCVYIVNLSEKVKVNVEIDYDYTITNPLAFIKQAKYLGKSNSNADSSDALDDKSFESAENKVIDVRIRDISKYLFLPEDVVEMDQSEMEGKILTKSNEVLDSLGVHLNFITLTLILDDFTKQAIDVATALKIYKSKGIEDLGKQIILQKAGAATIKIDNKIPEIRSEN